MKILITQESNWLFEKGPYDQHHFAEMLSLRGHEVRVIDSEFLWRTPSKRRIFPKRVIFDNVSRVYNGADITLIRPGFIKIPGFDYISLVVYGRREIERQINEFKPDIILGLGILFGNLAVRLAKKYDIPFIDYWGDIWHASIKIKLLQFIGKVIEKDTLKKADLVLASNKSLKSIVNKIGAPLENIYLLSHGVDFKRFSQKCDGALIRRQFGIRQDDIVLLYLGNVAEFSVLKEVVLEFSRTNYPRLKLLIVGDGDLLNELREIQKQKRIEDKLILTGRKAYDEIPSIVAAADICLLPYDNIERTRYLVPLKVFNYFAMGKPVISIKIVGMLEEYGEDNGILYVDEPAEMVTKAIELVANGNMREIGAKAKKLVEGKSWDNITDELEIILRESIEKNLDLN